jgi:2-hydroxychromene-2-carboxylate isomerase
MRPVFYFDLSSPYAYLAALRIGDVIGEATWRPIAFGILLRETGRVPWSLDDRREAGIAELAERARRRGVPPLRYPPGWPRESYSLRPVRAAVHAERNGALERFALAAYGIAFVQGRALGDDDAIAEAAVAAGLDPEATLAATTEPAVKATLAAYTDEAIAAGVVGVPTLAIGDRLLWGDDQLDHGVGSAHATKRVGSAHATTGVGSAHATKGVGSAHRTRG